MGLYGQVDVAISDRDFERRADDMDMYDAYVLDPWTWAGKGEQTCLMSSLHAYVDASD